MVFGNPDLLRASVRVHTTARETCVKVGNKTSVVHLVQCLGFSNHSAAAAGLSSFFYLQHVDRAVKFMFDRLLFVECKSFYFVIFFFRWTQAPDM
jgi:hypothetical protein